MAITTGDRETPRKSLDLPAGIEHIAIELAGRDATTDEQKVLDNIFDVSISHDRLCALAEMKLSNNRDDEDLIPEYRQAITRLCAIIAAAATKRIPMSKVFSKPFVSTGAIWELKDDELDAFLRPIFEESGIGYRFVL